MRNEVQNLDKFSQLMLRGEMEKTLILFLVVDFNNYNWNVY